MININLRRESPQDNVNRILALESLIKYYPLSVVEEIDKRCIQEWIEEHEGQDVTFKQIDMAFIIFGLPTPELKHLMKKVEERMQTILKEQKDKLTPEELEILERGGKVDLTPKEEQIEQDTSNPEVKPLLSREEREKQNIERYRREAEKRLQDHHDGIVIEENKEEKDEEAEKRWEESKEENIDKNQPEGESNEAKIIQMQTNKDQIAL